MSIYVGDIGARIEIELIDENNEPINCEKIIEAQILYKKPNGESGSWKANIDLINNKIYYITKEKDLSVRGLYKVQPKIHYKDGSEEWTGRGEIKTFLVEEGL
jgi:hypothetical protein